MNIRQLTGNDGAEFQVLRLRALKEHPDAFADSYESQNDVPLEDVAKRIQEGHESPHSFILGGFVDDDLCGMVGFGRQRHFKASHRGYIWGMYVTIEHQGSGMGRALLTEAIDTVKSFDGVVQIELGVASHNTSAKSLYESLGFETYGHEKRSMFVDGRYIDEDLMVLRLDS